jgi:hypothetical protein
MIKKVVLSIVFSALITVSANHAKNAYSLEIDSQDDGSKEYIIEKGDTLWDISDNELEDNFLWPRIWNVNPEIENPDLIYPGRKIRIPSMEELMRMRPAPKKMPAVSKPEQPEDIPVFIMPEQTPQEYIVDRRLFISSGWISNDIPVIGKIIHTPTTRQVVGKDDETYLATALSFSDSPRKSANTSVNDENDGSEGKFFAIRHIKVVRHPVTGKKLGNQIRVTGIVEITGKDDNTPKAKVIESYEDVEIGDELLPYQGTKPPYIPDVSRRPDIQGYIVESHMNVYMSEEGGIIFLDKGINDGLKTGDVFSVFVDFPVKRPIGEIQVISLQETTSGAVIVRSSQEITIGLQWGNL